MCSKAASARRVVACGLPDSSSTPRQVSICGADRFDGALDDIFDLQDSVTQLVVGAISPELDRAEIERARRRPSGNIDAVTEAYRGLPHVHWPTTPETNDAPTLSGIDFALFHNRVNFEAGIEMVDRAIRSNPNWAQAYNARGWFRAWDGGSDEAIADFERSIRLSPRDPFTFTMMLGIAFGHFNACRHAEAAIWADRSIRSFPYFIGGLPTAIAFYVEAGRLEDAQTAKADLLRLSPEWRIPPLGSGSLPIRSLELNKKFRE